MMHGQPNIKKNSCVNPSIIQGDENVSAHLMITIQKVTRTRNVRSLYSQSPDIY